MSERSGDGSVRRLRALALVALLLAVAGSAIFVVEGRTGEWWSGFGAFMAAQSLFLAVFTWLVAPREPRNPVVWVMAVSGLMGGIYVAGWAMAANLVDGGTSLVLGTGSFAPGDLPAPAAWILLFTGPTWAVALLAPMTFGLLLFPDGHVPSPRWRWVGVLAAVGITVSMAGSAWTYRPTGLDPANESLAVSLGFVIALLAVVLSLVAAVRRYRRSRGVTRDQFKWVLWGTSVFVPVVLVGGFFIGGTTYNDLGVAPIMAAEAILVASYAIAVGRFQLYDVDVVISRTVVYGTLAVFITGVYVGAVVGIGALFGRGGTPDPALEIAATAAVAVAFQPVRRRVQRAANRIVYGRRATPYEVLSQFSHRVAATGGAVLEPAVQSLVEGTGAVAATIWVEIDGDLVRAVSWPPSSTEGEGSVAFPIVHEGVELGRLTLEPPPGQRLSEGDHRLAREVASGMGLALRNRRMTSALQSRIDELRRSRRRLVSVQDETRRRLERDLHDGAQQQLVAIKVKLGLAQTIAQKAGGTRTAGLLEELGDDAEGTVDTVRDFARGIYPPLLEAEGLRAAITSRARRSPIPVTVDADGIGRHGRQIEATVYFCVTEAMQNAVRHSGASEVAVTLAEANGSLIFEVRDDGDGFDADSISRGHGLSDITNRVDSVGGTLALESGPGRGTTVRGIVPREAVA